MPPAPSPGRRSGPPAPRCRPRAAAGRAGTGVAGPSMLARCSIRLSTPPSEVARFHSSTRAAVAIAAASPPRDADRQHAAEPARHLARGHRMAGNARQAGIEHLGHARVPREMLGDRAAPSGSCAGRAGTACACRAAAATPRSCRAIAAAAARAPSRALPRRVVLRGCVSAPAITSEWPFRYLVAECMTRSAPSASGCVSTGVATVESTASRAPAAMRDLGRGRDVGDLPQRIGRRLEPDQPGRARAAPRRQRPSRSVVSTSSTAQAPAAGEVQQPAAQRPVHHLAARPRGRRARAPGTPRSPPPCPTRTAAPRRRPRARSARPRPGRRPGCRRAHRRGPSGSRRPDRARRWSPARSPAPRPRCASSTRPSACAASVPGFHSIAMPFPRMPA